MSGLEVTPTVVINRDALIGEGGVVTYPRIYFEDLITGERGVGNMDPLTVRSILRDWLDMVDIVAPCEPFEETS